METLMRRMKKRNVDVSGVNSGEEALDYSMKIIVQQRD